jgi:hypothetical protein
MFFVFLRRIVRIHSKLIAPSKNYFLQKFDIGIMNCKTWCPVRIRWKNAKKFTWKKVRGWKLLYTVIKVKKSIFCHFLVSYLCRIIFSTGSKSASNSAFLIPLMNFCQNISGVVLLALFADFEAEFKQNG